MSCWPLSTQDQSMTELDNGLTKCEGCNGTGAVVCLDRGGNDVHTWCACCDGAGYFLKGTRTPAFDPDMELVRVELHGENGEAGIAVDGDCNAGK